MNENPYAPPAPALSEIRPSRLRAWHALALMFVSVAVFVGSIVWANMIYSQQHQITEFEQTAAGFLLFFCSWTFLVGLGLAVWIFIIRPPFKVMGEISREDVKGVVAFIERTTYVRANHMLTLTATGADEVDVRIKGKMDRGIRLQKRNGAWHTIASDAVLDEAHSAR